MRSRSFCICMYEIWNKRDIVSDWTVVQDIKRQVVCSTCEPGFSSAVSWRAAPDAALSALQDPSRRFNKSHAVYCVEKSDSAHICTIRCNRMVFRIFFMNATWNSLIVYIVLPKGETHSKNSFNEFPHADLLFHLQMYSNGFHQNIDKSSQ